MVGRLLNGLIELEPQRVLRLHERPGSTHMLVWTIVVRALRAALRMTFFTSLPRRGEVKNDLAKRYREDVR